LQPSISISNLRYHYAASSAPALDGVSLTVEPGAMVALLGPNGSGKSTLLRLIAQTERPQHGTIEIRGGTSASAIRRLLGVVFQNASLDPRLTVEENLRAYALLNGLGREGPARISSLLHSMGLDDRIHARVATLSMGLARRVDLCRALLHKPSILLLDEPTAGLDPPSREAFLGSIEHVRRAEGTTVLLSTHLVDEAERCDRVILMHRGRIAAEGSPIQLRTGLGSRVLTVLGSGKPPALPGIADEAWTRRAEGWTAPLPQEQTLAATLASLLADETPGGRSFTIAPPSLADLFVTLTGQELANASDAPPAKVGRRRRTKEPHDGR